MTTPETRALTTEPTPSVSERELELRAPVDDGIAQPLRSTLEFNETVWSNLSAGRSAPEHPTSKATPIQVNGEIGIRNEIDLAELTVRVEGPRRRTARRALHLGLRSTPSARHDHRTQVHRGVVEHRPPGRRPLL